jgi:hypothetical protein
MNCMVIEAYTTHRMSRRGLNRILYSDVKMLEGHDMPRQPTPRDFRFTWRPEDDGVPCEAFAPEPVE